MTNHVARNQAGWDAVADEYQAHHGPRLAAQGGMTWGLWQIPEAELNILGDVRGRDVLELGCGAAQWSIALARKGARPVGVDVSGRQLHHARKAMAAAGLAFPLIQANAESVPLADESFDIVFCDHGATSFTDPYLSIPEATRLLRPGGLLAFSHISPLADICWADGDNISTALIRDYFGLHTIDSGDEVTFNLPYGEWIRLFRACGLEVLALVEPRPAATAVSSYWDDQGREWARRWPAEAVWRLHKPTARSP